MSEEIIKVLDYICGKLGLAIDWTAENVWPQVMDVLGRYRIMMLIGNAMWITLALGVIIIFIVLWYKAIKARGVALKERCDNLWWDYYGHRNGVAQSTAGFALTMCTVIIGFIVLLILACCFDSFLRWFFVPEMKYLEMLKSYVQ